MISISFVLLAQPNKLKHKPSRNRGINWTIFLSWFVDSCIREHIISYCWLIYGNIHSGSKGNDDYRVDKRELYKLQVCWSCAEDLFVLPWIFLCDKLFQFKNFSNHLFAALNLSSPPTCLCRTLFLICT